MSVSISAGWKAECSEAELVEKLKRLRRRIKAMDVRSVSRVIRVDPVCDPIAIRFLEKGNIVLPPVVQAALDQRTPRDERKHADWCIMLSPYLIDRKIKKSLLDRFYKPLTDFLDSPHGLWNEADLPEQVTSGSLTTFRKGFSAAFANALLHYGFLICVNVDKGCDSLIIGLSGYKNAESPLWLGGSSTKTQYAERFVHAHETICRIFDMAKEEGLLDGCNDTCGFYRHRDWKKSASIVNEETTFARVMSDVIDSIAEESGGEIEVISDPVRTSHNLINIPPEEESGSDDEDED
jgi:hypothetical protein